MRVVVTEGFQVNHRGHVYGPGETFEAAEAETQPLLRDGLVKKLHPPRNKKAPTARNKGRS